jgi:hypothetical protein
LICAGNKTFLNNILTVKCFLCVLGNLNACLLDFGKFECVCRERQNEIERVRETEREKECVW